MCSLYSPDCAVIHYEAQAGPDSYESFCLECWDFALGHHTNLDLGSCCPKSS